MLDCVLVGDSIAVGMSAFTPCALAAQVGRTARDQANRVTEVSFDLVIISVGSNDEGDPMLTNSLRRLRAKVDARRVVWIMPYRWSAAEAVKQVAVEHREGYIQLDQNFTTKDGVHPVNSRMLADWALR